MKKINYLLFLGALFVISNVRAQSNLSLDNVIGYAESVRVTNGEKSDEYLKALDSVVQVAFLTDNQEARYAYRSQYVEILEAMKGKYNRDYVNALWSLGYACEAIGDTTRAMGHYQECLSLLDKMMKVDESNETADFYIKCVYYVFRNYCASNKFEKADSLVESLIQTTEKVDGKFSCHYLGMLQEGAMVASRLNKVEDFVRYSALIIDNDKAIDSCNYTYIDQAYQNLMIYYNRNNQVDKSLELADEYVKRLFSAGDGFLHEKANILFWLSTLSSDINNDYSIECGKGAEQLLHACYNNQGELFQDPIYYPIVNNLATLSEKMGSYKDAVYYYAVCCKILMGNGMKDTRDYYEKLFRLFLAADHSDDYKLTLNISKDLEGMIPLYSMDVNNDNYLFASRMCNTHMHLLDFDEAMSYCDKMIKIEENVFQDTIRLASTLSTKAQLFCYLANNDSAIETIQRGKALLNSQQASVSALSSMANLLSLESQIIPGDLQLSITKIDSALVLDREVINSTTNQTDTLDSYLAIRNAYRSYAIDIQRKGDLYSRYDGYSRQAMECYQDAASIIGEYYSKNSVQYTRCMLSLADKQILCHDFTRGLITLDELKPYLLEVYGEISPQYADYLAIYANYYSITNNPEMAMDFNIESSNINKEYYGEFSTQYAFDLSRIGVTQAYNEQYVEAATSLYKSLMIMDSLKVKNSRVLNYSRHHLAHVWYCLKDFEKADSLYMQVLQCTEELCGKSSNGVADIINSWGYDLYYYRNDPQSFQCFSEAIAIKKDLNNDGISNPVDDITLLALYLESGLMYEKELNKDYLLLAWESFKNVYLQYVSSYSSNDRERLWRYIYPLRNLFFNLPHDYCIEDVLYDFELYSKSALLTSYTQLQSAVNNSGEQGLIDQYNEIQEIQRTINLQSFDSTTEDQLTLNNRKASLERELLKEMYSLGYSVNSDVSYRDVSRSLKPNEVAVEFSYYYHLKDKVVYNVALLAKSTWEKPKFVYLCTENELKSCIGNPNVTYSTDDLYRLLWQPLAEYIHEGENVYFSPSVMLHTIALESLHTPDGSCLSDKYNLVRLTSTRELCKERQPQTYETGAVYGGLQYDVDQKRMTEVAAMNKIAAEESPVFALRGEDRGNWNYLQGTKDEVEHIAGIMRQANIGCHLFEGDLGNEESFKALSGSNTDIIHLATHGYFIEGEKADMNDFMQSLSPLARQKTDSVIDPLLRSGLILSGGNRAWLGQEVPEGIEDGVLTALEISTMNLSGTDMVVMSACETGLGDITSDGVFGLQRAFKMAGVQTLVMSLWKVDDNATSLMMQTFYEHLLSGMSKREAFNLAQAAVKAKYPEPYYWAGFVMLD